MMTGSARFSSRSAWPSHPNALSRLLEEKRRQKAKVLDLTESNPTRCGFRFYRRTLLAPLGDAGNLRYGPDPRGLLEARKAVCRYYAAKKVRVVPEQVFLTAGTSEAYGFLFDLLADAGDEALAAEPSYPLFDTLAQLHGVTLRKFPSLYEDGWRLDTEALERAFTPRTKALLLVHPNNPTGHFVSNEERWSVAASCERREAALIVDEVFLDYAWGAPSGAASFAGEEGTLTFTLSGVSKAIGLPQMKLSWVVVSGPEEARAEAMRRLEIIADAYLSVSTPSQRALASWMRVRASAAREINARVKANYLHLKENVPAGFRLLESQGGWYAVIEGPESAGDEELALRLLDKQDVLVHPGFIFDLPGEHFWVLSLLPPEKTFRLALKRLLLEVK